MIREVVSETILRELRDPRIRNVTVLGAEVSSDLRYAKVRVSVRGDDKQASLTMHGLNSARGFLQSKVAEYIKARYTPELRFILDQGISKSIETSRILSELNQEQALTSDEQTSEQLTSAEDEPPTQQADESALTDSPEHPSTTD